ncbi:TIGR03905 family TSCPD domain-containing protein [Clostridium oceanicum]|uniref:ribonucleoside-diphosphate reductase n=1 Tax=Clostridium oceanicum TaxID=1543 RepID=A0ABN1JWZ8_9CLOT
MYTYSPKGVCSRQITFDVVDGKVKDVKFVGGCNGNLKGIGVLIEDMPIDEAIKKLKGITCGNRPTSCPDQLSKALEEVKN